MVPRVSIGLAVRNGENYLRSSIESILAQTYTDFELIISDNASTDTTAAICKEYRATDRRIRYYRQDQNVGLSKNNNFVLGEAQGEYFKWVAHDDIHAPDFVSKCVGALDADPTVVLACPRGVIIDKDGHPVQTKQIRGKCYWIDRNGNVLCRMRPPDPPKALDSSRVCTRFRDILLRTGWCMEIYGLMRTAVLRRTGLNGDFYGADKPLLAEMSLNGRFLEIPEVLFFYRQHPAQEKLYRSSIQLKQLYVTGKKETSFEFPRFRLLQAYWAGLLRAPISTRERLRCVFPLIAYCLQVHKWPHVFSELYQMMSIRKHEEPQTFTDITPASPTE